MIEGLNVALYGMGTVFFFLTFLVGMTITMSSIVGRYSTENVAVEPKMSADGAVQAAIAAAVHRYRQDHSQ